LHPGLFLWVGFAPGLEEWSQVGEEARRHGLEINGNGNGKFMKIYENLPK
jgi:hypothetical protein